MSAAIALEQVFFVSYRDVALGHYPMAEPVVLIDPSMEHHYIGVRQLELRDSPRAPTDAPPPSEALPLFPVDRREAVLYEAARPAVIAIDTRRG
jgi:hypothetical protein